MKYNIIKFSKPGCAPCKVVDELLKKHNLTYSTVDLIDHPEVFKEYGVTSVPTILVLNNKNEEIKRVIGVVEHALITIKENINGDKT